MVLNPFEGYGAPGDQKSPFSIDLRYRPRARCDVRKWKIDTESRSKSGSVLKSKGMFPAPTCLLPQVQQIS